MEQIIMPKLGLTMEQGTLIRWLKQEGDGVEKGEVLFEVETDKSTNDVEATASGTLAKILLNEGETAEVLQVIGYLLEPGEKAPEEWPVKEVSHPVSKLEAEAGQPERATPPTAGRSAYDHRGDPGERQLASESGAPAGRDAPGFSDQSWQTTQTQRRAKKVSPRARRLAAEKGLPLSDIRGSGPGGRVVEQDVIEYIKQEKGIVPTRLQRITAERMRESFATTPHFYLKVQVDASELVAWRKTLMREFERSRDVHLTFTDLLIALVAHTLKNHPRANASWDKGRIQLFEEINLGLAVVVDDGLIVPVLKNADEKTLEEITTERHTLVERATAGKLSLAELEGGTFTLTNLGMFEIDEFSAIINPPQSAILAIGRIAERVVAQAGRMVIKPTLALVLSVDHRVLDGAVGARFLRDLKHAIESPGEMHSWHTDQRSTK